jgi:hypothetical protein
MTRLAKRMIRSAHCARGVEASHDEPKLSLVERHEGQPVGELTFQDVRDHDYNPA